MVEEKTLRSETVYRGRIIQLRVDTVSGEGAETKRREIVVHPGAAAIVAMTDESILMVEQYRRAVDAMTLEIPAGTIEAGESPEECAARELVEETGFRAAKLDKLIEFFPSPGISSEVIHIFKAGDLERVSESEPELSVRFVPKDRIQDMISNGELRDGKTLIGVLMALRQPLSSSITTLHSLLILFTILLISCLYA